MPEDPTRRPLLDITVAPGRRTTISLVGDLDPHTAPLLDEAVAAAGSGHDVELVVIDLGGVAFVDSSGLRVFVAARESLGTAGIGLLLKDPSANTRRLLDITGLGEIIEVA